MQCCGSEMMYRSDPDPAFPVISDPDPTTRPSNYLENFRCASWDCSKTLEEFLFFLSKYMCNQRRTDHINVKICKNYTDILP
jgi:hypothetical protein